MLGKLGTGKAIEVADATADSAFLMEVILAITFRADVLIKRSLAVTAVELAYDLAATKLTEVTVKAALARSVLLTDLVIEILYRKLTVGIAAQKADKCFSARCLVSCFSHSFSP